MFGYAFHHIGIACEDIEAAAAFVRRTYAVISETGIVHDPVQNARVCLFNEGTPGAIELVSGRMVERVIARGLTYYHVCYETPDLDAALAQAEANGALLVAAPVPAVLFGGRRVAFVYTELGLVEFLEAPKP